jgi:hypothetical protein
MGETDTKPSADDLEQELTMGRTDMWSRPLLRSRMQVVAPGGHQRDFSSTRDSYSPSSSIFLFLLISRPTHANEVLEGVNEISPTWVYPIYRKRYCGALDVPCFNFIMIG